MARINREGASRRGPLKASRDMLIGLVLVVVVMMIIIPIPTVLLDTLMAFNLIFSLMILLIVIYTIKPTDFSLFPFILLAVTVFGLALNISSTRLILVRGARFDGRMVRAFSSFVVGSGGTEGLVVGFIIFIVIIAVQVMVITKGATRVSEVAARFALDSMQVKQMAIEAELSAQSITEEEARTKKAELEKESAFYGAMDGASNFISGNVKVGILITVVNIVGGIINGVAIHQEPLSAAVGTYITFSIGDGLVSQLPALLVSTAMGIVVTRAAATGDLGQQVDEQFARDERIYWVSAVVLAALALIPGFPWYVLAPMSFFVGIYAFYLRRRKRRKADFDGMMAKTGDSDKKAKAEAAELSPIVSLDPLSLELGYGLIPLVDKDKGAELLDRIQGVRRQSGLDLGLVIPKIRIMDNMMLEPSEYCFKIKGVDTGRGKIRMGYYLCINSGNVTEELAGEKTQEPTFGLPALWISEDRRDEAERAGYTVVDPPSIIATHLTEIIKQHAADILGRQDTQAILDHLNNDYPAVVGEVLKAANVGIVQKVFQGLLRERVSIRNTISILESIADYAPASKNPQALVEKARQALGSQICHQYADDERRLHGLTIDKTLEEKIIESGFETITGERSGLDPQTQAAWLRAVSKAVMAVKSQGYPPVILCSEAARRLVKDAVEREIPELAVISVPEISPDITVMFIGVIKLDT
ncbi:MAG: flagellar biosynthesis protein FlhA [Treponema sp.]|nr:flagellar biosynthesis protein FlhA [Treponema sp.]